VILVIDGVVTEIPATEPDRASELSMTHAPFSCEVLGIDDRTVVIIRGEVDLATAPRVLQHLRSALALPPAGLAVDVGGVTFMDSSGVHMLLTMRKAAAEQHVPFILVSITEQIRRVLEVCNLSELFEPEPPTNATG
jgi:anti-sigma B factor antagonist